MSDIVERLRDSVLRDDEDHISGLPDEAADEIERLRAENERLRKALKKIVNVYGEAADEIERLRRERDEATRYAENLAVALSRHFPHVSQWKPLTGDLVGLLTQIDNMTTGLSPSCAALGEEKRE